MAKATNKESAKDQKASKPDVSKKDKKKAKDKEPEISSLKRLQLFLKESWGEFRKIQWPTPKQAANESVIVLITVVFMIALVTLYDLFSNYILSFILQK
ncbi:MAG: preprotein translocase subunit SecE [Candidatus Melainabacteria bacterium HGW-Melainabacteria-1]|nr:MAG: preprotein translocase subunit SecE [Candidatus Melainabacteria bacterium HGW-Melainabacteria-1]